MCVIEEEIRKSTIFLALLSATSVRKTGIVQREFKIALSHQDNKPSDRTFIIPILLEDCKLPTELSHLQYVDLTNSDGYESAFQSIQQAFEIEQKFRGAGVSFNSLNYPLYAATIESPVMNSTKKDFVFQAPFPGVFYRGTSPNDGPYRREGEKFKKGDPLFIIECFKMFHEFSAEEDGIVGAFLAENGDMLKRGSPVFLFYYEKSRKSRVL